MFSSKQPGNKNLKNACPRDDFLHNYKGGEENGTKKKL